MGADPQHRAGMGSQEGGNQAATGSGEKGSETSITAIGTGEREAVRRACCTSEAVPAPPGKAITSTEAENDGEVWAWASMSACSSSCRLRMGPAQRPKRRHSAARDWTRQPS